MPVIIALHAAKGSGKDTFYKIVKKYYPHLNIKKVAFADPIKKEVMRIYNLKDEEEYDKFKRSKIVLLIDENEDRWVEGRQIVRETGMLMRSYDENQFTQYVDDTIATDPTAIWFITDTRFANELEHRRVNDYPLIKIKRPSVEKDGHVTELEFRDEICDYIVINEHLQVFEEDACRVFEDIINNYKSRGESCQ